MSINLIHLHIHCTIQKLIACLFPDLLEKTKQLRNNSEYITTLHQNSQTLFTGGCVPACMRPRGCFYSRVVRVFVVWEPGGELLRILHSSLRTWIVCRSRWDLFSNTIHVCFHTFLAWYVDLPIILVRSSFRPSLAEVREPSPRAFARRLLFSWYRKRKAAPWGVERQHYYIYSSYT